MTDYNIVGDLTTRTLLTLFDLPPSQELRSKNTICSIHFWHSMLAAGVESSRSLRNGDTMGSGTHRGVMYEHLNFLLAPIRIVGSSCSNAELMQCNAEETPGPHQDNRDAWVCWSRHSTKDEPRCRCLETRETMIRWKAVVGIQQSRKLPSAEFFLMGRGN